MLVHTNNHSEGDEALEQVAKRNCECPIPGSALGQAGWDCVESITEIFLFFLKMWPDVTRDSEYAP